MNEIRDSITYLIAEFQRYYPQWVQEGMEDSTESVIKTLNRIDANLTKNTRDTATGIKTLNTTMAAFAKTMGGAAMTNIKLMKDEQTYRKAILENLKKEALSRKEQTVQLDKAIKSLKQFNTEVEELNELHEDLNKTIKMNTKTLDSLDTELEKLEDTVTDTAKKTKKATDSIADLGKTAEDTSLDMQRVIKSMANYHFVVERFMNQVRGNLSDPNNVGRTISGMGDTIGVALEGVANRLDKASPLVSAGFTALSGTVRMLSNTYGGLINASEDQIKTYRELNKAGILLSRRFDESAYMARDFGLNHDQMVKAMISNNSLFSKASSDTMQQFLKASHMATRANSIYARLGYTQEETMDFMAKYIENMKITGTYEAARSRGVVQGMIDKGFEGIQSITQFFGKELMDVIKQTNEFMRKGETQAQMAMFRARLSPEQQSAFDKKLSEAEMIIQQMPEQAQNTMRAVVMQQFAEKTGSIVPPEVATLATGFRSTFEETANAIKRFITDDSQDQKTLVANLIEGNKTDIAKDTNGSLIAAASALGLGGSAPLKEASTAGFTLSGALQGISLNDFFEKMAVQPGSDNTGFTEDEKKSQELLQNTVALSNQVVSLVATFNAGVLDIAKTQFGQESFKMIGENIESATTLLQSTMEGITTVLDTGVMGQIASNMDKLVMIAGAILAAIVTKGAMSGIGGALKAVGAGSAAAAGTTAGSAASGATVKKFGQRAMQALGKFASRVAPGIGIVIPDQMGDGTLPLSMAGSSAISAEQRFNSIKAIEDVLLEEILYARVTGGSVDLSNIHHLLSQISPAISQSEKDQIRDRLINKRGISGSEIPHFARGGVIGSPTVGLLAEAGRPEMVMPLDPAMSDLAKHIAEKHVEIVGPFLRQLNRDLIYNIYRENIDPLDLIFTKSLDKFFFSKMEIQRVFDQVNSGMDNAGLANTINIMETMGFNVTSGASRSNTISQAYSSDVASGNYTAGIGGGNATSRAMQAMQFFMSKGWSREQAAAIVGNLQQESGMDLNHTAFNPSENAFGIAQWREPRQEIFEQTYGMRLKDSTFEQQLEFIHHELLNQERSAGDKLRSATTVADATVVFDKYYERSSGQHRGQRISNAQAIYGASGIETNNEVLFRGNGSFDGVDPRLASAMTEALKTFPLRGAVLSGRRGRNRGEHARGNAVDIVLYDQNGIPIPNYGEGSQQGYRVYELFAQHLMKTTQSMYPELADGEGQRLEWGGQFGRDANGNMKYGSLDMMDFRIVNGDVTRAGDIMSGLHSNYRGDYDRGDTLGGSKPYGPDFYSDMARLSTYTMSPEQMARNKYYYTAATHAGTLPPYVPNTFGNDMNNGSIGPTKQNAQTLEAVTTAANVIADKVVSALNTTSADTQRVIRDQQVAIARMNGIVAAPRGGR